MKQDDAQMASQPSGGTRAVDRAAALIDLVIRAGSPLSFTDLCDDSGLARSTTSRLLTALERTGLVEREVDGRYVGGELFALYAALHDPWPQVARIARPVLEAVGEQCGETVHLGVARADTVVHIAQVESTYLLSARDWNQVDAPAHCNSLGKVLYAFGCLPLPPDSLERPTDRTLDRSQLLAELDEVRRRRWAYTADELEIGLSGLAAPVEGLDDTVIAALGVSGPTARLQQERRAVGEMLVQQARRLTGLLRTSPLAGPGAA